MTISFLKYFKLLRIIWTILTVELEDIYLDEKCFNSR